MKQFLLTPSAGKRLIGKASVAHPTVRAVLEKGTLVIIAGTTNGYVAEEILASIGQSDGFSRKGFRRGITVPIRSENAASQVDFSNDVVIVNGVRQEDKTIFDVVDDLTAADVILKGANAVDLHRRAAVLIGDPHGGTAAAAIRAVVGRRVRMIIPVGLEKRVNEDVTDIAAVLNAPGSQGPRMLPLPGEVFTELDAISIMTGASARLVAAGGVCGAEGACWIAVTGSKEQISAAEELIHSVADEPLFQPGS
ncbi:MAG: hypothetical protein SVV80_08050 [Planctomycetota bacterium]|nr:hypothetical protein [Planctomycetota bacterium]